MQYVRGDVDINPLGKPDAFVCGVLGALPSQEKCGATKTQDFADDLIQVHGFLHDLIQGLISARFDQLVDFPDETILDIRIGC